MVGHASLQRPDQIQGGFVPMEKSNMSAGAYSERETKSRLGKSFDINTLRKPLRMTATLKRRALKKKPPLDRPERVCEQ
jgi:hypothetical protein